MMHFYIKSGKKVPFSHLDPHVLELLPDLAQYNLGEIPRVHVRRVRGGGGRLRKTYFF